MPLFFCLSILKRAACSQAFLAEITETGGENLDKFHICMQMSLVMSMQFILGDDCYDTLKLNMFLLFGDDVIFPELRPLIFLSLWACIIK